MDHTGLSKCFKRCMFHLLMCFSTSVKHFLSVRLKSKFEVSVLVNIVKNLSAVHADKPNKTLELGVGFFRSL